MNIAAVLLLLLLLPGSQTTVVPPPFHSCPSCTQNHRPSDLGSRFRTHPECSEDIPEENGDFHPEKPE